VDSHKWRVDRDSHPETGDVPRTSPIHPPFIPRLRADRDPRAEVRGDSGACRSPRILRPQPLGKDPAKKCELAYTLL